MPCSPVALQPHLRNLRTLSMPLSHTHTHTHARVQYLHPEEGDAGQEVNSGLEILETLWVSGWEIILEEDIERGK